MDIESILSSLGLDLTNPEVKKGAMEAIDAIIGSRQQMGDMGWGAGGASGEQDVEIDPDLLQPSIKNKPQESSDDIEINDEDDILKDVRHNDSDEPQEAPMSNDTETGDSEDESTSTDSTADEMPSSNDSNSADSKDTTNDPSETEVRDDEQDTDSLEDTASNHDTDYESAEDGESDDSDVSNEGTDDDGEAGDDFDSEFEGDSDEGSDVGDSDTDEEEPLEDEEDEFDIDEDELLDDTLKDPYEDSDIKSKHEARKIKRERTLQAARKALADAQARNKTPALIRELEKAIEALESLQEAVAKNIKDISDEEFNLLVNRVFDAIDALGDSELTYTSEEERKLKAQEIKADIENKQTQAELSAEDVAQIRAETQAIKAREKEKAKYAPRARGSFKGFQDFLNSLYRAIALQVHTEESRDDTWSAISRRNSGNGVLQQGKKINELPNRKIPIIDFYFDQSGSWGSKDIKVGNKAVEALMDMEKKGKIKINLYYFGNYVSTDPSQTGGGTSGWNEIVKNVIATQATNVIIMTDADMENWWSPQDQPPLRYTVPGCVWYLWRYGENAPRLPQDLKGRGGTQQFSFGHGDA